MFVLENAPLKMFRICDKMMQKFTWFVDMNTSATALQVIKITAGGDAVKNRLAPFFGAFKYFKLGPVSVKFVPASTLPVDPTGLSLAAGENTVDPRDQFNPGLIRITNGEDVADNLMDLTGTNIQNVYYSMMLDRRWYKFQLQAGVRRTARPLFWSVAQLHQDAFPGATMNIPHVGSSGGINTSTDSIQTLRDGDSTYQQRVAGSSPRGLFQTGIHERMSWLPTDFLQALALKTGVQNLDYGLNNVPEVELMKIVLPKAYKTSYYYRVYITETVYFKDPVVLNYNRYAPMDRFVTVSRPVPSLPGSTEGTGHGQDDVTLPGNQGARLP